MKFEAALLSREMPAESAQRADWSDMVSHIYLEFGLAQAPRWVGCSVTRPGSASEGAELLMRFQLSLLSSACSSWGHPSAVPSAVRPVAGLDWL